VVVEGVQGDSALGGALADVGLVGGGGEPGDQVEPDRGAAYGGLREVVRERPDQRVPAGPVAAAGAAQVSVDRAVLE
jgi:hypothetical protein